MSEHAPKISVCIPVRNGEHFLLQAVESALQQSCPDFEIVIIDNVSTDGTLHLAEEIAAGSDNVHLYRNERNIGLVGNFNACLRHARGKYIKFLCADDLLLPSCLERMAHVLDNHPSISLVAGGRLIVDEGGAKVGKQHYAKTEKVVSGPKAINRCLFGANYIGEPTTVMFRKETALRGFREDLPQLMDMEMWFHLLEQGDLANLPEPLCAVRHHSRQMTVHNITSGALIEDNIRLFEEYREKPYIRNTWFNSINRRIRMAYRIWLSRQYLDPERRSDILKAHSCSLLYYLAIPVLAELLAWLRTTHLLRGRNS